MNFRFTPTILLGRCLVAVLLVLVIPAASGLHLQEPKMAETDLRALMFGDAIPGFYQVQAMKGTEGPLIELDLPREDGSRISRIRGNWRSLDDLNWLEVHIVVCDSPERAMSAAESFFSLGSNPPTRMPGVSRIGDASWTWPPGQAGFTGFVLGRTYAWVHLGPRRRQASQIPENVRISVVDGHHHEVAATLARALEWSIRQKPGLLAKDDQMERRDIIASGKEQSGHPALTFQKQTWVSLSAFEGVGARVKWNAKTNRAIVCYKGKTLELRPFHHEARVDNRRIDLKVSVLPGPNGPVVPVRDVAEALGIKLVVTQKTLRLG